MDDSTRPAGSGIDGIVDELAGELAALLMWVAATPGRDLATAEREVRSRVLAIGARVLSAGLAVWGTGKVGPGRPCPCGATARYQGDRAKGIQTLVGWVTVRRAYYWCRVCGRGTCPLDAALGVGRDSHGPGVRRALARLGASLPFGQAAATLQEIAGVQTSASTVRTVTEAVGARREAEQAEAEATAWRDGLPPAPGPGPDRLYVAMDGVRILATGATGAERSAGKEAKVGVVRPEHRDGTGDLRAAAASFVASFEPAEAFGRRLALETYRRGQDGAGEIVVLGDGAAWIWHLAAEHFPGATQVVDWYHASERVWALGRAHYGEGTTRAARWVGQQLHRLARGEVRALVRAWRRLRCRGTAAVVRDEQVAYFTNQAGRMAYHQYRARGLDIGSGMVEGACKHLIGAREKGPGMRWGVPGANAVAQVRVLLFNDQWADYHLAA